MRQNSKAPIHEKLHTLFSFVEADELALYRYHSVEDLTLIRPLRNFPLDPLLRLMKNKTV